MTSNDHLRRAGELLHGAWWHTLLALNLGVSRRSVQRWATGAAVPEGVLARLPGLLRGHSAACVREAERIEGEG